MPWTGVGGVATAPADLKRGFDRFLATKPRGKGGGSGLFITAANARKRSDEMTTSSAVGRGARSPWRRPLARPEEPHGHRRNFF